MAPKLSRPPDPRDPQYQSLERRINLALHIAIFVALNSGLWFYRSITYQEWQGFGWIVLWWGLIILNQGIWVGTKEKNKQKAGDRG